MSLSCSFQHVYKNRSNPALSPSVRAIVNMTTERVPGLLVYHKDYSFGRPCPMLPNWLVLATRYKQTSWNHCLLWGYIIKMLFQDNFFCQAPSQLTQLPCSFMPTAFTILVCSSILRTSFWEVVSSPLLLLCPISWYYSNSLTAYWHTSHNIVLNKLQQIY